MAGQKRRGRQISAESLEEKISKAQDKLVATKKTYDEAARELRNLLEKRDAIRKQLTVMSAFCPAGQTSHGMGSAEASGREARSSSRRKERQFRVMMDVTVLADGPEPSAVPYSVVRITVVVIPGETLTTYWPKQAGISTEDPAGTSVRNLAFSMATGPLIGVSTWKLPEFSVLSRHSSTSFRSWQTK